MPRGLKSSPFPVLVVGIEAMSVKSGPEICKEFLSGGVSMTILDESSRIKHHNTKRTENVLELYQESQYRLALTGTNITQGLQDLYTQMQFVEPRAIGEISYYSFKNKYCVMGGYGGKKIIGYTKTDILMNKVRPYCDVIRKSDMKDLPLKSYQIREVQASREQKEICKNLRNHLRLVMEDKNNKMKNVLEAMLIAQQVAGGFDDEGNPLSSNPKMKELLELLEDFDGKAVIWARFLPEIEAIRAALNAEYPGSVMVMTGNTPQEARQSMVDIFQKSSTLRFFVSNHTVGGAGITLTSATLAVYYSNTFNLEDRLQSEDRIHRIGQTNPCMYVDISSDLAVDKSLIESIARKSSLANFVSYSLSQEGSIDSLL
jgi:SNF2 family DNA or RNA helicase